MDLRLQNRYVLTRSFGKGQFGKLYEGIDTLESNAKVVVKISPHLPLAQKEYMILKKLNEDEMININNKHFPKLYAGGEFIIDGEGD